jgi:hypothetical protein
VGAQVVTDLATGVTEGVPELEGVGEDTADALLTAIKGKLPEETVKAIGLQLDKDVGKGIEEGKPDLIVIVEALADDAWDALAQEVTLKNFPEIGKQMDAGIAQGITDNSGLIESAARDAAWRAYEAARTALQINSPSKKGDWLGEMFDLGFAGGIRDNADEITDAMDFLNDVAAADAEPVTVGRAYQGQQAGEAVDYDRIRDAFVDAIEETGVGHMTMEMDKQTVGETLEPVTSRATRQRQQKSVKGRTSRLVMA